jgi:hypothetical protein
MNHPDTNANEKYLSIDLSYHNKSSHFKTLFAMPKLNRLFKNLLLAGFFDRIIYSF